MPLSTSFSDTLIAHLPRLRAFAIKLTRNPVSADDLLQDTAYLALRAHRQFIPGTNFSAWVNRILRNQFISSLRRGKDAPVSLDDAPVEALWQAPEQEQLVLRREVKRAMQALQPAQRAILMLTDAVGLDHAEIGKELKCPIGTVKSRIWRARLDLKAVLAGGAMNRSSVMQQAA